VGCGALGTVIAELLTRAGIGRILLVDRDLPDLTNLQRQSLFDEEDIARGLPKSVAAADKLRKINSSVVVEGRVVDVKPYNILGLIEGADLVMDALDNLETRFLLNDACVKLGIPWIYCACVASTGMIFPVLPKETACLRCIVREAPPPGSLPTCASAGILAPAAHAMASLAAGEALKLLSGAREKINRRIVYLDVWDFSVSTVDAVGVKDPECPCCGEGRFDFLEGKAVSSAVALCGREAVQVSPGTAVTVSLAQMAQKLKSEGDVTVNEYMLKVKLSECALTLFPDGRALFEGVTDVAAARALYARYVGI
jgi:adenylyltransferase/sulfurtransferase